MDVTEKATKFLGILRKGHPVSDEIHDKVSATLMPSLINILQMDNDKLSYVPEKYKSTKQYLLDLTSETYIRSVVVLVSYEKSKKALEEMGKSLNILHQNLLKIGEGVSKIQLYQAASPSKENN